MQKNKFITRKDECVFKGAFIEVIKRHYDNAETGEHGIWEMVQHTTRAKVVAVVAVTERNEVVLIKSYRIPMQQWVLEVPGGLADVEGESEQALARRELLEETGYTVKKLKKLASGPFDAGLVNDEITYYMGIDGRKVREQSLDDAEDIEVMTVPLSRLEAYLLKPPRGLLIDVKMFAILYWLKREFPQQF